MATTQLTPEPALARTRYNVGEGPAPERPHIPASSKNATKVEASVIINRPPMEVYEFWRDVRNHTKFLHKLKSVEPVDEKHSHWVMTSFYDVDVEWDAEIIHDVEGELISWCTVGKPMVQQAGTVRFNAVPGNPNQTHLRLLATVVPPPGLRGVVGVMTAALFFQDPERALKEDLQHLKEILEKPEEEHPPKIEQ
jgi:uncharacterized membrane protein